MRKVTAFEAECISGKRLDRRCSYMVDGHEVLMLVSYTDSCTGCLESEDGHPVGDYPYDEKAKCLLGMGCSECGYTGKRVRRHWCPALSLEESRALLNV